VLATARSRRPGLIAGGLGAGVAVGVSAWLYLWPALFPKPIVVETERARAQNVHLYYAVEATEISPKHEWKLGFDRAGVVAEADIKPGDKVKSGQMLARLKLNPREEKVLAALRGKAQDTEKKYLAATLESERLLKEINDRQAETTVTQEKIDQLQKDAPGKLAPAAARASFKKELAALKKTQATIVRELVQLRLRGPVVKNAQDKLSDGRAKAKSAEQAFIDRMGWAFLQAPAEALVKAQDLRVGSRVDDKSKPISLVDPSAVIVRLRTHDEQLLARPKGGAVRLTFGDAASADGQIVAVGADATSIEVADSEQRLAKAEAKTVRAIKETVEQAIVVGAGARLDAESAYVVEQNRAVRRTVHWLDLRGKDAIARDGLHLGDVVVIGPADVFSRLTENAKVVTGGAGAEAAP
jgi:hypothetical protein